MRNKGNQICSLRLVGKKRKRERHYIVVVVFVVSDILYSMKYVFFFVARGNKYDDNGDDKADDDVDTVMTLILGLLVSLVAFSSNRKQLQSCNHRKKEKKKNTNREVL